MKRKTRKIPGHLYYKKRNRLIALGWILIIFGIVHNSVFAQNAGPIKLSWLGGNPPAMSTGVSWGVPLPERKLACPVGRIDPSTFFEKEDGTIEITPP